MNRTAKMIRVLIILSICTVGYGLSSEIGTLSMWTATQCDKLRHDLLLNYDKFSRPTHHSNTTKLRFGITITHVELQEFKSTLAVHGWIKMVWNDDKLRWNASNYGNLSVLRLAEHEFWQPDIYLYNSALSASVNQYGNTHSLVYPNGEVLWVPPVQLNVLCQLHLKYWPFDTQECSLMFGSWTHHGEQIDIQNYNGKDNNSVIVELSMILDREWKILEAIQNVDKKEYECCPGEIYPYVNVKLTISRVSAAYKTMLVTPALLVILLTLWSFWLPPQASEKVILNGCTAVIVSLFLLYFTQQIPIIGDELPQIVQFYVHFLFISGYSMIESALVISLSRVNQAKPLPWVIKKPLTGLFGHLLGLGEYIKQTTSPHKNVEVTDHGNHDFVHLCNGEDSYVTKSASNISYKQDWILLAAAIDRIFFISFSMFFIIGYFCLSK
ncbi:unnamed protein product [Diabrotica balteata]|uniref:Uncharacterized protein n=1 Tax=Diabrotica balteata TaxID=107213 RepID=A0A9N9XFX9_DIABA|nr:unnamed protein product [Diabrotica balteata]